ncbi:MAG: radical SAM protein, partial [Planctomycetota bacterium]|jgi:coproporphyrinogen III oxidase-like Fe-S oxidoreductase
MQEIKMYRDMGYCFDSVYVGGGTPTVLPDRLAQIIELVKDTWQIKQISVETNPNHLTPTILRILKDVGVDRLSVGVQSFNNKTLRSISRLQRYGTGEEIKERLFLVNGMFDALNIDMIFNFPNQTDKMLTQDIETVKEVRTDQVTYYPLMVSTGQKQDLLEKCGKVNRRREKRLYKLVVNQLADMYDQRSVWCFSCKEGTTDEYIVDYDEYVGLGPGSFGYINGAMYSNTFSIQRYISMLGQNRHPIVAYRSFSRRERMHYELLIELLDGSLNLRRMNKQYGKLFWPGLGGGLLFLLATRAGIFRDRSILLTPKGRYYCLMLMRTFFSVVGDYRDTRASLDAASSA